MKTRHFYEIKAQTDDGPAEVWIYGQIGRDFWGDGSMIDASVLCPELAELKASHINVRLNSPGGQASHGHAIYNALLRHPATVTTFIDGLAASAASEIALSGDEVVIAENGLYMIHMPYAAICGYFSSTELRHEAEVNDKYAESLSAVYQRHTGIGADEIWALMEAETWYTGQEAVDAGFCHRVSEDGGAVALAMSFDFERLGFKHVPDLLRGSADPHPRQPEESVAMTQGDDPGDTDPTLTATAVDLLTRPRNGGL